MVDRLPAKPPSDFVTIYAEPDGSYRREVTGNPPTHLSDRQMFLLLDLLIRRIDREATGEIQS